MASTVGVRLSTDLDDPQAVPYFLWDAPMTVAELSSRLAGPERTRLLGTILREGRDTDVWRFTSPSEVIEVWPELRRYLGRRRAFWEFLLGRWREQGLGDESVIVDLVVERTEQVRPEKLAFGRVKVDPVEEIFANKLCTLLGRSEIRDLVDARALEMLGLPLADALAAGQRKDGGLTPGQLAFVLSQITIADGARLPGDVAPVELREYLRGLIDRLARLAHP